MKNKDNDKKIAKFKVVVIFLILWIISIYFYYLDFCKTQSIDLKSFFAPAGTITEFLISAWASFTAFTISKRVVFMNIRNSIFNRVSVITEVLKDLKAQKIVISDSVEIEFLIPESFLADDCAETKFKVQCSLSC